MVDKRISSCDVHSVMLLQKTHLGHFIPKIQTAPDLRIFLYSEQAIKLAKRILNHSVCSTKYNQLISYDTTFNLAECYLSTLLIKNIEMDDDACFPIAFFLHERKTKEAHHEFLKHVFDLLGSAFQPNIPVVTDREKAITSFMVGVAEEHHFCCTNHILSDVKL